MAITKTFNYLGMNCYNLIGLILNTLGAIALVFAQSPLNGFLKFYITLEEKMKDLSALSKWRDEWIAGGYNQHFKKASRRSDLITKTGLLLLIIGFILQLIGQF